jgi:N-carbamoylputrescine amidase
MRVALLHLDLSGGPEEKNLRLLERTIQMAAEQGASWIITPEIALQGYFFAADGIAGEVPVQPGASLQVLGELATRHGLTLFLGCAEKDAVSGKPYNSCVVLGPHRRILGRHRKMRSHGVGAEAWLTLGEVLQPVACPDMTAGILICADVWFVENAVILKECGAEVIIVPAAWPPGVCGPGDSWEKCSQASGLPVWVCNQTGCHEILDLRAAQSAVVADGITWFTYSGEPAILLFDWDCRRQCPESDEFTVMAV